MISQTNAFELFADYHQILLADDRDPPPVCLEISEADCRRRLSLAPGLVVVHTARNMTVPVVIEIRPDAPPLDEAGWDHVTECSLEVETGRIVVAGLTDYWPDAARIGVKPGSWRVRALHAGLDTLSPDGLDGEDRYRLVLWPAAEKAAEVLQQAPR
jgi:hypothetical protein